MISIALSALTAFSAGGTALTTALYSAPTVYASGLSSQDSKLLKKEKDLMMSVAKDVFGKVQGFGYFTFAFDTILDMTDAFGTGGSGSDGISREDLEELREHLDEELNELKTDIARLGVDLTNEIKMTYCAGNLGQELLDMHITASINASNIARYKSSSDYPTENDKLVMVASLIGSTGEWGNTKENLVYRMYQIGLLLKGTTYSDLDGKSLYNKVYDYYASKSLFSSEIYDKAVPYINSIVYEYLYAYSVLVECLDASLRVARFTSAEEAALSDKVKGEYNKIKSNSASVIEDEIGTEALMLFNYQREESLVSQYSTFLYNADNNRFTYLNKGTTKKAVKSSLGSYEPGTERSVDTIRSVLTDGTTDTEAHNAYKREKDRLNKVFDYYSVISCGNINNMGSYVSSNYSNIKSVWDFLKDRGFTYSDGDSKTSLLVAEPDIIYDANPVNSNKSEEYDPFRDSDTAKRRMEYEKTYYLQLKGYVYNDSSLSAKKINIYSLTDKKIKVNGYQSISYDHKYWTSIPSPVNSKPLSVCYFQNADSFKNVSTFSFDPNTNLLTVNGKATGATGRQTVRVQYRDDSDDAWTTSYAPTTTITLKGGCDYEVRVIISDEAGNKETTDTFYCTTSLSVDYIDADGTEKNAIANLLTSSTTLYDGWYVVKSDVTIHNRITCQGFVHLILCDGCKLTSERGISVIDGEGTLSVYGQKKGTGTLEVTGNQSEVWAGIGGVFNEGNGLITINGGEITITVNEYAKYGAAIGGGRFGAGNVVINGGTINVTGGGYNTSIGGGYQGNAKVTINGGNINVDGAIGCGTGGNDPTAVIKLSWKNKTDSIKASYRGDVTLEKTFNDGENTYETGAVTDNSIINGKTLVPGESAVKYFTVTWKNYDGTILETDERVKSEPPPTYNGETPAKASDEQYEYTFKGWSPEITAVNGDTTYTAQFESKPHTYGEPVWSWSDDYSKAKATFTCTDCEYTETVDATVTRIEKDGQITYTAVAEFNSKTCTDTKTETYHYVPASEPYIDNDGAYILGTVGCYEKDGKYYAVNADGTIGKELNDLSLSYFDFEFLWNGDCQINCYTGSYDSLANNELVIPKTFNGKKITHLGGTDGFMKATGTAKQFTLVLNENITNLNSNAFANTLVTKVTGNTSGLTTLGGSSVFARVNSKGGYTLDIELDYPKTISCGYKCFDNVKVTVRIKHSAVLNADFSNAKNITYIFTDDHIYSEPTWTWSDDHSTAKAAFTCTNEKCGHSEMIDAVVVKTEQTDKTVYTATAEFNGKTYTDTYTEEKEETYVYYPAEEPYIDDNGAYILGYKEHYRYKGKYYAVNKDKSVGAEITDIWISYFTFELLPNDTYQINKYTGPTKNLTEIVIPKTFNEKKITTLGTDNMDIFTRANKPIYTLVLNENIIEIKPNAFYSTGVTKVTGNTSGLNKIGNYAFSWVNSADGNKLDITFDYPGLITIGDSIFTHTNVTVHSNHAAAFSSTKFGALSIKYDFADEHTYGEPVWNWSDDYSIVSLTLNCTDRRCNHQETVEAEVTLSEEAQKTIYTATAVINGVTYIDSKEMVRPGRASNYWTDIIGGDGNAPAPSANPNSDHTPKTGDTSPTALAAVMFASLTAVLLLAVKRRKNEDEV